MTVRYLSVASGIEGASAAWDPLGWTPVGFSEIDPAASAVLAHHYPHVHNYGDFSKIFTPAVGPVDLLVGGTPCQAFSVAGARGGLGDVRGNLALAYVELAHELVRKNALRNCLWENVPGVLSMHDNAFGCFLGGLVGADDALLPSPKPDRPDKLWRLHEGSLVPRWPSQGMASGPSGRLAWRILDAQYFGLAQRRRRLFVVCDFGTGADPAAILFERASLSGNIAPSRQAGQGVAPTLAARTRGGGGHGTDFDCDGGLVPSTTHTLRADGFDASEDGTGRGTPLVAARLIAFGQYECDDTASTLQSRDWKDVTDLIISFDAWAAGNTGFAISEDTAGALRATDHGGGHSAVAFAQNAQSEVRLCNGDGSITAALNSTSGMNQTTYVAQAFDLRGREGGAQFEGPHDTANIRAASGGSSRSYVVAPETAGTLKSCGGKSGTPNGAEEADRLVAHAIDLRQGAVADVTMTLQSGGMGDERGRCINAIPHTFGIARDCINRSGDPSPGIRTPGLGILDEMSPTLKSAGPNAVATQWAVRRLTPRECERLQGFPDDYTLTPDAKGKLQADGPRYKQLGNSFAVPVIRWIGRRIENNLKKV